MRKMIFSLCTLLSLTAVADEIKTYDFCLNTKLTKSKPLLTDKKHKIIFMDIIEGKRKIQIRCSKWSLTRVMAMLNSKMKPVYKRYPLEFDVETCYEMYEDMISNPKSVFRLSIEHFKTSQPVWGGRFHSYENLGGNSCNNN